jgi:hypothetical protein
MANKSSFKMLLFSKYSDPSKRLLGLIQENNLIERLNINLVCIDNEIVRKKIESSDIEISVVPCLLVVQDKIQVEKYEGKELNDWISFQFQQHQPPHPNMVHPNMVPPTNMIQQHPHPNMVPHPNMMHPHMMQQPPHQNMMQQNMAPPHQNMMQPNMAPPQQNMMQPNMAPPQQNMIQPNMIPPQQNMMKPNMVPPQQNMLQPNMAPPQQNMMQQQPPFNEENLVEETTTPIEHIIEEDDENDLEELSPIAVQEIVQKNKKKESKYTVPNHDYNEYETKNKKKDKKKLDLLNAAMQMKKSREDEDKSINKNFPNIVS